MKVSNPVVGGSASGSLFGMTASSWRGINVMRKKPVPTTRSRGTQSRNRSRIGFLARNWGYLDETERVLWRLWASQHPKPDGFGGTFLPSGNNAYTELNVRRMMSQDTVTGIDTPPVIDLDVGINTLLAVDGAADGAITLNWTFFGTGLAGDKVEVSYAGPFSSPGVFDAAGHYKVYGYIAGNLLTSVMTGFIKDAWYWFKVRYVGADGQASAYLTVQHQAPDVV